MANLTESQILILADYYWNRYNVWGAYGDLYHAMSKHGDQKFLICKNDNFNTISSNENLLHHFHSGVIKILQSDWSREVMWTS